MWLFTHLHIKPQVPLQESDKDGGVFEAPKLYLYVTTDSVWKSEIDLSVVSVHSLPSSEDRIVDPELPEALTLLMTNTADLAKKSQVCYSSSYLRLLECSSSCSNKLTLTPCCLFCYMKRSRIFIVRISLKVKLPPFYYCRFYCRDCQSSSYFTVIQRQLQLSRRQMQ